MREPVGVPIVVLSRSDENVSVINTILREAGHPAHCVRLGQINELDQAVKSHRPDLLILFADEPGFDLAAVAALQGKSSLAPPLLLVQQSVNEQSIAAAMECGAKDVVSLTHRNRLLAVVERELEGQRLRIALDGVLSSANLYKQELRDLMDGASEAIADVLEGIVVSANPAWLGLFGYTSAEDLVGMPFMDLFRESDRQSLKGALVACRKGKWGTDPVQAQARRQDGTESPIELRLERVTVDGEPAVRVVVALEAIAEQSPAELLEQAVYKDPSTGFYHRHYFLERLETRLPEPLAGGIRAMAYIRPDHFARVHDDIGLLGTEALLMRLAELLKEFMQPTDLYGRFGGTMFVVLLERGTTQDAEAWAEQLRKAVANQVFEVEKHSTTLTCTIGLSEVDPDATSVAELLTEVEQACRTGRDAGGNRVQWGASSTTSASTRSSDANWAPKVRNALMKNRLRLVHQPITGLNEEIDGVFDTRVRLLDDQDQLVLPGEFMPAAERTGLAKNVDRWVIGASLSFCAAKSPNLVFVRLSRDSVTDPTLLDWLQARLSNARVTPSQLCFQITEELAAQQLKHTKELAERLRGVGFRFAIDHAGIGRDSGQVLKHVPMDYVKIDGSLMQGLHRDKDVQRVVGDIAQLAKELGINTIAERVEDANTMAVLWQLGIAHIQGNYVQMHGVVLEDTQTIRGLALGNGEA